jgi:S1/P1 Nuclease
MRGLVLALTVVLGVSTEAFGWGSLGHQAIGELADMLLRQSNPGAHAAVQRVLGTGDTLERASTWPDDLKRAAHGDGPLAHDPEARAFNQKFPHNGDWHFVNLPLGMTSYADNGSFSTPTDVVHMINACIKVLETPNGRPVRFSKRQALRFLVHLVGDLHQPLHVTSGYYRFDSPGHPTLVRDPQQAAGLPDDRGGNDLQFGPAKEDEVHFLWDITLVERLAGTSDPHELATKLAVKIPTGGWPTSGNYHAWAERWATAALDDANAAYEGLTFGAATFAGAHTRITQIATTLPDGYAQGHTDRATLQLAKGGYRLAKLLERINWR